MNKYNNLFILDLKKFDSNSEIYKALCKLHYILSLNIKIVYILNIDLLNENTLFILKIIDNYNNCFFIFTCLNINKINTFLFNRCILFNIDYIDSIFFYNNIKNIFNINYFDYINLLYICNYSFFNFYNYIVNKKYIILQKKLLFYINFSLYSNNFYILSKYLLISKYKNLFIKIIIIFMFNSIKFKNKLLNNKLLDYNYYNIIKNFSYLFEYKIIYKLIINFLLNNINKKKLITNDIYIYINFILIDNFLKKNVNRLSLPYKSNK